MNIRWTSPSRDALDSMPLSGSRGAGANVWVQDGSLWLYLGHAAAFDAQGRLLKLGCVRLTPTDGADGALANCTTLSQELCIDDGSIHVSGRNWQARVWFSGEDLVVETGGALAVQFATWRDRPSTVHLDVFNGPVEVTADRVNAIDNALTWAHHNAGQTSTLAAELVRQPWAAATICDPTRDLVFGGALVADPPLTGGAAAPVSWQCWHGTAWSFTSTGAPSLRLIIALRVQRDGDPLQWLQEARALLDPVALAAARRAEDARWLAFWARSWVEINPEAGPADPGWQVARNYRLFRYMLACNQGGRLPLLFNGGIFTVDNIPGRIAAPNNPELQLIPNGPSTPDFRRWMFCGFMSQNQRWLGWPAILAGDADLLAPSIGFYRAHAATAAARARGLGADGMVYPESLTVWGLDGVAPQADGLCAAPHLLYDFAMMLEHAWMALHAHRTLATDIRPDLPWILGTVIFFDSFYRQAELTRSGNELGGDGRLVIYPANSIEFAGGATNPIEVVAALRRIIAALLTLESGLLDGSQHIWLTTVAAVVPELPTAIVDGRTVLRCAQSYEKEYNLWEFPEFFAVWPYRLLGVTKPGSLAIVRTTWESLPPERVDKIGHDLSWMPLVINMAGMGDVTAAQKCIIDKLSDRQCQVRFPAFFGPGHDWLPDHNWGGSAMVGLQEMLLAADPYGDDRILLFPAWPRDWDVRFRLHAPGGTVIEAELRKGILLSLKVTPDARRADVVLPSHIGREAWTCTYP